MQQNHDDLLAAVSRLSDADYFDLVSGPDVQAQAEGVIGIMGDGSPVTDHEAQPWLGRIRRHTTMKFGWSMVHAIEFQKIKTATPERQKQLAGRP